MFRVGRDNEIMNFRSSEHNSESIICVVYGEIDCRCHIQRQIDAGSDEDMVINNLVTKYFVTLKNNIKAHKKVVIVGIIPPTKQSDYEKTHGPILSEFPFVGTDEARVRFTRKMNKRIEEMCDKSGYLYFNPYEYYTREDGTLKRELSDTNVHLGDNSVFLERFLEKSAPKTQTLKIL